MNASLPRNARKAIAVAFSRRSASKHLRSSVSRTTRWAGPTTRRQTLVGWLHKTLGGRVYLRPWFGGTTTDDVFRGGFDGLGG